MLVYGKNVLKQLNLKRIKRVYLNFQKDDKSVLVYLKKHKINYVLTNNKFLDHLVTGNHQGIVVDIEDYQYYNMNSVAGERLVVVLDHIEDPHNLGAIIRSCECAGVKSVIIPKNRAAAINDTVMKVSAGALDRIKIIRVTNLATAIEELKKRGFFIYAADLDGIDFHQLTYHDSMALIIGNEGKGISRLVKSKADYLIRIPLHGHTSSLNAAVAAGILIYEMIR